MKDDEYPIGVGATPDLSLRVSVAALVRVLFRNSTDGRTMLALERTATCREVNGTQEVDVKAKPFGGGVRITDPRALRSKIGDFHYDSERSRRENDFRIYVRPDAWETVKTICREGANGTRGRLLDSSPARELAEEFEDALGTSIEPHQYRLKPNGITIEDRPAATPSVRAFGKPTVRVYYVFEAWLEDAAIVDGLPAAYRRHSDADLQRAAADDAARGGRGRANGILVVALDELLAVYRSVPVERRGDPIRIGEHRLDANVLALLWELEQARYVR